MTRTKKLNVEGVGRLPTFSHAVVAGDWIFVSGSLGTKPGSFELVPGGAGPQTAQTLANIRAILAGCGATLADVVKVNVFLTDMTTFREMNEAYLAAFPGEPPARITVGCAGLALGAAVEIDCIALAPKPSRRAAKTPRRKTPERKARGRR
jgi:2-iminobutanoate/2-iminopropanoate deaminase